MTKELTKAQKAKLERERLKKEREQEAKRQNDAWKIQAEEAYLSFIEKNKKVPILQDIVEYGVAKYWINQVFGNFNNLHKHIEREFPDSVKHLFNESYFTDYKYISETKKIMAKYKKFVVTTAVSDKAVDQDFLASVKNYCSRNKALLLVLPCEDVASRKSEYKWELDPSLNNDFTRVISVDTYFNDNFYMSSIMMSAKQINPLTGLDRLAKDKGSMIAASPKQFLKYVPTSQEKLPHALMTPGAITIGNYATDLAMSKRTSYLAEFDHTMGAIVVEVLDKDKFFFRQVQTDETGIFTDLSISYYPDGSIEKQKGVVAVFGDSHASYHDPIVKEAQHDLCKKLNVTDIVMHDVFDGSSISHHDKGKPMLKAAKAHKNKSSLVAEGKTTADYINSFSKNYTCHMIRSNHDEVLNRYIVEGRFISDPENCYKALDLAKKYIEGKDIFKDFMLESGVKGDIVWVERDKDYKLYGIELGNHGDLGANGSRGSIGSIEKCYSDCVIGHSHTAGILRGVYQVGTSSLMKLSYNRGPSSWTHTICLIYPDGTRQLVNIIDGKWRG